MHYSTLWNEFPPEWATLAKTWFESPVRENLERFLAQEQQLAEATHTSIFPQHPFTAFSDLNPSAVRIVILGQDPYHGIEQGLWGRAPQACGRAFAVSLGMKPPPSLRNIFKGIEQDLGSAPDLTGTALTGWAKQGVLLLNTVLTVRQHQAASHAGQGWEIFTDVLIKGLAKQAPRVWLLWGSYAQKKIPIIQTSMLNHLILCAPHPSPLSAHRGFFSAKHFSQANQWLINHQQTPINWLATK